MFESNITATGAVLWNRSTSAHVEQAFNKAVELATVAATKLPEGCVSTALVQTLFLQLCSVEDLNEPLLKERVS